jgi:hypothetical protein
MITVSTEKQEKQGESLRTQTAQIKQYVKSLGGASHLAPRRSKRSPSQFSDRLLKERR